MARLTDKQRRAIKVRFGPKPSIAKKERELFNLAAKMKRMSPGVLARRVLVDYAENVTGKAIVYEE
jgi:hypothetical protein